MAKDPQTVLAKYQRGIANAGQSYKEGVASPRRSWATNYAASADRMAAAFLQAVSEGKPQAAVRNMGDQGYQAATLAKADRYSQSAPAAGQAYAAVVGKVMQAAANGQQAAAAIQPTTWGDRVQRMRVNAEAIARTWGKTLS